MQAFGTFTRVGRGEKIRTSDPLRPRQVRYQTALRPDNNRVILHAKSMKSRFFMQINQRWQDCRELHERLSAMADRRLQIAIDLSERFSEGREEK